MASRLSGPQLRRRILSPPTFISFGMAALLLAFFLTRFDIDLGATWRQVRSADVGVYLIAFTIYYLTFPVRGYRWRLLIRNSHPQGTPRPLPPLLAWAEYLYVGWFINTISWFRMGDAYRGYLLSRRSALSFSRVMGSLLAERVLDIVVVAGLLAGAAAALWASRTSTTSYLLLVAIVLVLLAVLGVVGMALIGERLNRRLPPALERIYRNFHEGTLGSFRKMPLLVGISTLAWLLEAGRLLFMARALGLEISAPLVLFTALAGALLTTTPITPGGVGIVEAGMTGLFMLTLPRSDAIALTVLDRSASYLSILVFGSVLFFVQQASQRHRPPPAEAPSDAVGDDQSSAPS